MSTVVIDAVTRDRILAAAAGNGVVELRDETGTLVAKVVRPLGPPTPPPGYVIEGEWPSDEELDRRMREDKRYSTAEVVAHLRRLNGGEE
jgi:hypothetical protein